MTPLPDVAPAPGLEPAPTGRVRRLRLGAGALGLLILLLVAFVVAATALYGPQAAALVEMFPTRVRYTAMSFPYHVGTGWVGGFLPVTSFALVAITGNIYEGLWYSVVFTGISVIVSVLFLKETAGRRLEQV